ncbi:MAG TPA: sugar ABC transporter permease [Candidatus Pelethocola excrementipullorum]|nr:sugar ABC transporter permease [Candidatus Pelethocola excrementipullorum]
MSEASVSVKVKKKYNIPGYLFILPSILFFVFYILYPIVFVGWSSVYNWSTLKNMTFVGLENYTKIFQDKVFWTTMRNSLFWIITTVPIQATLGFFFAYIIEERLHKKKGFYRTIFFLPVATSVAVVAIVWGKMLQPYQGIITHYLSLIGIKGQMNILGMPNTAIFGCILANIWEWTGWSMIMYVAGMSQIPEDMKEAAKIDGATKWKEIRYIYFPALSSTHKSLLMLGIIGSLQTFGLIYTMTGGGPNHASEMPGTYIFQMGFTNQQMGYASALSMVTLVFALVMTIIQVKGLGAGDFMKKGDE